MEDKTLQKTVDQESLEQLEEKLKPKVKRNYNWKPTVDQMAEIERMAMIACPEKSIATILGISHDTFERAKVKYPEIAEAIQRGSEVGIAKVQSSLFKLATDEKYLNLGAIIFWLKCRAGWRETSVEETKPNAAIPPQDKQKVYTLLRTGTDA